MTAILQEDRSGFIGGTDAIRIMAGEWHQLWLEKTKRAEPVDLSRNFQVQLGIYTEPFHVAWLQQRDGYVIKTNIDPVFALYNHVQIRARSDGIVTSQPRTLLEMKHTGGNEDIRQLAYRYMPQMQLYMWVHRFDTTLFSVIMGNREPDVVEIEADEDYTKTMLASIGSFWSLVIKDKEPEEWGKEEADAAAADHKKAVIKVPIDGMIEVDMAESNAWMNAAGIYLANEEAAKNFEQSKVDLKELMPDNAAKAVGGGLVMKRAKNNALRITKEKS